MATLVRRHNLQDTYMQDTQANSFYRIILQEPNLVFVRQVRELRKHFQHKSTPLGHQVDVSRNCLVRQRLLGRQKVDDRHEIGLRKLDLFKLWLHLAELQLQALLLGVGVVQDHVPTNDVIGDGVLPVQHLLHGFQGWDEGPQIIVGRLWWTVK